MVDGSLTCTVRVRVYSTIFWTTPHSHLCDSVILSAQNYTLADHSRAKLQYNSMKVDTYDRSPWPDDTEANQEWCEEVISLVSSTIVKKSGRDLKDPKVSPFKMFNLHIIKGLSSSWIRAISVAGIMILHPLWAAAKVCFQVYVWEPLNGQVCTQK